MGFSEGKILAINTISKKTTKMHEIWYNFVNRVTPRGYPLRQSIRCWWALSNDALKSKIGRYCGSKSI